MLPAVNKHVNRLQKVCEKMQIVRRQHHRMEIDLFAVIKLFWKKKIAIILSGLIAAAALWLAVVLFVSPKYSASITLYANNSNSTDGSTSISTGDISASVQLVDTYAAIILSDPVIDQVIEQNNLAISGKELLECISIGSVNDTEGCRVSVVYTSAEQAASIANAIAEIAPVKIADIVDGCSVKIVNYAKIPTEKASPSYKKACLLGGVLGIFISVIFVFVEALLDTHIKSESDLQAWDVPVLGLVPLPVPISPFGAPVSLI